MLQVDGLPILDSSPEDDKESQLTRVKSLLTRYRLTSPVGSGTVQERPNPSLGLAKSGLITVTPPSPRMNRTFRGPSDFIQFSLLTDVVSDSPGLRENSVSVPSP